MNLATRLDEGWKTLEAGGRSETLFRSLADCGVHGSRMLLGVDGAGCRELLFPLADRNALGERELRDARGVKVLIRTEGSGAGAQHYVVIRCAGVRFHPVFKRFAAALVEEIAQCGDAVPAALEALRAWHEMFARAGRDKSETFWCGLFGELHELRGLVSRNPKAIESWTGPYCRPQDFIRGKLALEVKSSRSHVNEVEVHGLEQLWARPYELLGLVVKHVVLDSAGERVADVVASILSQGVSAERLNERLETCGVDEEELEVQEARFSHRSSRYFRISEDSPVLTPDSLVRNTLPVGVSGVRYQLALDSEGLHVLQGPPLDGLLDGLGG